MNELQKVFSYQGNQVRTIVIDGEPWFVAKDICEVLEIEQATRAVERLDEDEKGVSLIHTPGGNQEMLIVNEPGLYSLILGSRKPEAKAFKRWITHEVLPSIRQTGGYMVPAQPATLEDLIIMQAQSVKELKAKVAEIEKTAITAQDEIKNLKDALIHHDKDWRRWVNNQLQRVGFATGDYSAVRHDSYKLLEERGRCRLKIRLANLRERLAAEGATKTLIDKANYMDVIEVEPRLKEIYTTIVKELAIRYAS